MIAISTFRPLDQSEEIARNQIRAKNSWNTAFDGVILFGDYDPRMASPNTFFIDSEDFPTVSLLCRTASLCDGWACILNADIVVSPKLKAVWDMAVRKGAHAFTSYRYQYEPDDTELINARVVDNGFDFFAATPPLWAKAAKIIPPDMRIGHNLWDSWMLGFFNVEAKKSFMDITSHRCIFHPRHEGRKRVWDVATPTDKYVSFCGAPWNRL